MKERDITLITGGARSGKSSFALKESGTKGGRKIFVATAVSCDEEMSARIQRHRRERGREWETIEEPFEIAGVIRHRDSEDVVIVVDCVTVWLSNILLKLSDEDGTEEPDNDDYITGKINERLDDLIEALKSTRHARVFMVSNEVGMGIVPESKLGRLFRDVAGIANQRLAGIAENVYLMVSGLPLKIK
ncbi:MAG TPA: bifunctional adenosylcobinamide kinase/adenosylcobinamide-phosphate guanylyltransferase [Nitrospirae bacterium]|nr:bifunctional adenosylcobinamide kinase/adenosylcobinamide-phosphate guanylyltransferase [Nitrospirota bacterium]HDY71523.1 bifunctional adenosylcobinamide kinase/adenosylcobinamide-phosphate guanylyltransferase [Nitrospirota bacterium]